MTPRFLILLAPLLAPCAAVAQERVALDWSAPEGCPDRTAVLAELDRLVAQPPTQPQAPMRARGAVLREGGLYRLHLELDAGARDLQDESCARLGQVVALSLALALETASAPVIAPEPVPPKETGPAKKKASEGEADEAPRRWLVRAMLGGDLGSLRAPSPGPGLAVGILLGRTRLELGAAWWFAQEVAGIEYQLVSGGLRACRAVTDELEIGLCAGVEGGRMQARFVSTGSSVVHGWLGLLGGAALGWGFTSWLALRLEVDIGLTLVGPDLGAAEDGRGPSPVFGRAALGLEVRF